MFPTSMAEPSRLNVLSRMLHATTGQHKQNAFDPHETADPKYRSLIKLMATPAVQGDGSVAALFRITIAVESSIPKLTERYPAESASVPALDARRAADACHQPRAGAWRSRRAPSASPPSGHGSTAKASRV